MTRSGCFERLDANAYGARPAREDARAASLRADVRGGVSSGRHRIMPVRVVPVVVVVVSISVLQRHVFMFVRMALRDQERDAEDHQQRAGHWLTAYIPKAPDRSFVNFCCWPGLACPTH
jgi:hypothetical protein